MSISLYKTLEVKRNHLLEEKEALLKVYNKQFFLFKNKSLKEKIDILEGRIKELEEVMRIIQTNSFY